MSCICDVCFKFFHSFHVSSLLLLRMSLKHRALKVSTHDDSSDSDSESNSAAVSDVTSVIYCHSTCSLQSSFLLHSVAADDSITVNASHALSVFKSLTASVKDAFHSALSASHSASSALHLKTFIFTSICSSHLQSVAFSLAVITVQSKYLFLTSSSELIQSHVSASHFCHSAHDQKCSYCSIQ